MIVKCADAIIGITLTGIKFEGEKIILCMKNGSTLTLSPNFSEDGLYEIKDYSMDYVSKKENRKIEKLNEKMQALLNEINDIKTNGLGDEYGTDVDSDADIDSEAGGSDDETDDDLELGAVIN